MALKVIPFMRRMSNIWIWMKMEVANTMKEITGQLMRTTQIFKEVLMIKEALLLKDCNNFYYSYPNLCFSFDNNDYQKKVSENNVE